MAAGGAPAKIWSVPSPWLSVHTAFWFRSRPAATRPGATSGWASLSPSTSTPGTGLPARSTTWTGKSTIGTVRSSVASPVTSRGTSRKSPGAASSPLLNPSE